ncbi:MAG: hypothetical protein AAFX78_01815 [Cyanobacteria bacterium J06638_20]
MTDFDGRLPDGDVAFRVPAPIEVLPLEQQMLFRMFDKALSAYTDLEKVKALTRVQFVNYLSCQALVNVLQQQVIALQLERRELLGTAIEDKETIQSLARQSIDLAEELDDLRSDW